MTPYDWTDEMVADRNRLLRIIAFAGCLAVLGLALVGLILLVIVGAFIEATIVMFIATGVAIVALDLGLGLEEDR